MNWIFPTADSPHIKLQSRLLTLAAAFLFFDCLVLTFAPAVRLHEWTGTVRWQQWVAWLIWLVGFSLLYRGVNRFLPDRDPYLVPIVGLLSGWGLVTIFRLNPDLGFRQTIWFVLCIAGLLVGIRYPRLLPILRRYKYVWLTSVLVLTVLTLFLGTYPGGTGDGPGLWLQMFGVYLQPSELLKLALIIYLAAYLADSMPAHFRFMQLLAPTLVVAGASIAILIAQRDLGTASIFILLYCLIVYVASGKRRVLLISFFVIVAALVAGYLTFDVIRLRIEAWLNPWLDPSGRSYQIVQSLMAVANGGLFGRGLGLGSPGVVPVAQSDFIYSAIAEEAGLFGAVALLAVMAILTIRGIEIALHAPNQYQRFLAIGISTTFIVQAGLIIGGNIRLFPLTGVTLPFVSYGGSSLVTSFFSFLLLLMISNQAEDQPAAIERLRPYTLIGSLFLTGLFVIALFTGWWSLIRSSSLLARSDNPRRAISDTYVLRGEILDRNNVVLAESTGTPGDYVRTIEVPSLSATVGYSNPDYGQTGIEYSMDGYLRGVEGNSPTIVWWDHALYGQYPPGLNIRLSIDSMLQSKADALLAGRKGAIALMNAESGELLVVATAPTFNANDLQANWSTWMADTNAPLLNRVSQGQYPLGTGVTAFLYATALQTGLPPVPSDLSAVDLQDCAVSPGPAPDLANLVISGCPIATRLLASAIAPATQMSMISRLGFFAQPNLPIETAKATSLSAPFTSSTLVSPPSSWRISPLQLLIAASALSNNGHVPSPILVTAYQDPSKDWIAMPDLSALKTADMLNAPAATENLATTSFPGWETISHMIDGDHTVDWFIAGTTPEWKGAPLALVVVLEGGNPETTRSIGEEMFLSAVTPFGS